MTNSPAAPPRRVPPEDDPLLERIRHRYRDAVARWDAIRQEAATDIAYVVGDPWEPRDRRLREDAGRPCLAMDELGQYLNQVINDIRANPRAVKFTPRGWGANDETARFYADKMREIEYRSKAAEMAYTLAFENAVQRSYGFVRVRTQYVSDLSFEQELTIEGFPNPDMVVMDPDAQLPDASDAQYCFIVESWTIEEFQQRFPQAEVKDFDPDLVRRTQAGEWWGQDRVTVAEYWAIEPETRELVELVWPDGAVQTGFRDELGEVDPARIRRVRQVAYPRVRMRLTTGVEILEETEWPGRYLPIVACYGKVVWTRGESGPERHLLSLTRLARDPYMLYCYYRTCQAEIVGMTPKVPYFVREGALAQEELRKLQQSLHEPVAVIQVKASLEGLPPGQPPEFPQRNFFEPPIQALELGAEAARRAIQAAMGLTPLPTAAQRRNEKSGVALERIELASQRGSYHFVDHYNDMIRQVGIICEDLMDRIYVEPRDVGVIGADGTPRTIRINDPTATTPEALPSIRGEHTVTVSTGPKLESEREAASAFADVIIGSQPVLAVAGPQKAAKLIALAIKLKNVGPIGDQIAEILDPTPEAMRDWPIAAQQAVAEADRAMQRALQEIQALQAQRAEADATERAKTERELAKATLQQQTAVETAQIKAGVDLTLGEIDARLRTLELALARRGPAPGGVGP